MGINLLLIFRSKGELCTMNEMILGMVLSKMQFTLNVKDCFKV